MAFFFLKTFALFALLLAIHSGFAAFSGEPEEMRYSPETTREFLIGMRPPMNRGDWAAYQGDGRKTVATIVDAAGADSRKRIVVEIREYNAEGNVADVETQEIIVADAAQTIVNGHDSFSIVPVTATVKGEQIRAALLRGFRDNKTASEFTIAAEVPLGDLVRHYADGSKAELSDYGWGDEAYRPSQDRLSFAQAAERVAAALPEPAQGEWCEYFAPGFGGEDAVKQYLAVCGVDGRNDGKMLSLYGIAEEGGYPIGGNRLTPEEVREQYGEGFFGNLEHFTISRETILVKGEEKAVLTMNAFNQGLCGARLHFSAELPYPWLAGAVFLVEPEEWNGLRLLDWGWKATEDIEDRERYFTVKDAIGEAVDAGLEKAAVGDWARYETLDGGTIRYELVEIRTDWILPRYVILNQEFDASGKMIREEKSTNSRDEIVNGYILGGDVRADSYVISRSETTIMGESIPVLSVTGIKEGEPAYRLDLSGRVFATQLVGMTIFPFSTEPFWKLAEYGRR